MIFVNVPLLGLFRVYPELTGVIAIVLFLFFFPIFVTRLINRNSLNKNRKNESTAERKSRVRFNAYALFFVVCIAFLSQKRLQQLAKTAKDYVNQMKSSYLVSEVDPELMRSGWEAYVLMKRRLGDKLPEVRNEEMKDVVNLVVLLL